MNGPVTLETPRLLLRPYRFEDLEDVLEYSQDERWARFLPVPQPYTRADGERWIAESMLIDWAIHPRWVIEHRERCRGGIDLRIERQWDNGELGYSLAPELWGQGLMVEAAEAVIRFGFLDLGLEKVKASADAENRQSWRVMEKLGMEREGYFASERVHRGERRAMVWYGLVREAWEARRAV